MNPIKTTNGAVVRDMALAITCAAALVVSVPALAIVLFLLRGIAVAMIVLAAGGVCVVWLCREIAHGMPESWRAAIREYAAPTAFALSLVACMPAIAIVAFLLRGTLMTAFVAVFLLALAAAAWHVAVALRIAARHRHHGTSAK